MLGSTSATSRSRGSASSHAMTEPAGPAPMTAQSQLMSGTAAAARVPRRGRFGVARKPLATEIAASSAILAISIDRLHADAA